MKKSTKWSILGGSIIGLASLFGIIIAGNNGYKTGILESMKVIKEYDPEFYEGFKDDVRTPYPLD